MITRTGSEHEILAATELRYRCPDLPAVPIVDMLSGGLTHLRDLLMVRAHDDVQRTYGADAATNSLSQMEAEVRKAKLEIEAYACIVIDDEVTERGYVDNSDDWLLDWLFRLRLGSAHDHMLEERVDHYRSPTIEERRLKFVSLLQRTMPDSRRAPLVLFRLFPRSVRILAAVAFGEPRRAQQIRAEQVRLLPAIADCHHCRGHLLENEEDCAFCGNPVWNFSWLLSD